MFLKPPKGEYIQLISFVVVLSLQCLKHVYNSWFSWPHRAAILPSNPPLQQNLSLAEILFSRKWINTHKKRFLSTHTHNLACVYGASDPSKLFQLCSECISMSVCHLWLFNQSADVPVKETWSASKRWAENAAFLWLSAANSVFSSSLFEQLSSLITFFTNWLG